MTVRVQFSTRHDGNFHLDQEFGELGRFGVSLNDRSECTGCHADRYFSYRVRSERERQVMAVWKA